MHGEELAKLLGRKHRYAVMFELYPDRRNYVTELSDSLSIDRRNLGRYLEDLQKKKLVDFSEEQRAEGGKPYRYYYLTDLGKRIISTFVAAATIEPREAKLEKWQLDKIIQLFRDTTLALDLREIAVHRFFSFCQEDPAIMSEEKGVQRIFEEIVGNPTQDEDKISETLRASISTSFPRLLADTERREWVLGRLYPSLLRCLKDRTRDDNIRVWSLRLVGDVARICSDQNIKKQASEAIFEAYFSSDTNFDSKLVEQARQELTWLTSENLFSKVLEKTRSENESEKNKAEELIKQMVKSFNLKK